MSSLTSLVLFDVDGTLLHTAGAGTRAMAGAFLDVFGLAGALDASRRVPMAGRTDPLIARDVAREAGLDGAEVERGLPRFWDAYVGRLRQELAVPDPRRRVMPGVIALLDALRSREGVRVGLLTGNIERGAWAKLEAFGLANYFETGGFASDHSDRSEIARIARERAGSRFGRSYPAEEVAVVGDTDLDVRCARANGFRAVIANSGSVPRERIEAAAPDALFPDLADTGAVLGSLGVA
ncbi:MAG: HAD family hydrolase [Planctomycetales bacterium]|nr:HAD family hydrolase [Planctomycetales bacterium]